MLGRHFTCFHNSQKHPCEGELSKQAGTSVTRLQPDSADTLLNLIWRDQLLEHLRNVLPIFLHLTQFSLSLAGFDLCATLAF